MWRYDKPASRTVAREKLYEEVWAEPMTTVAKRYDVSSSFLARVCERLRVPRPPRGYWARLQSGKTEERPPLPEPQPGDELEWSRDGRARRVPWLQPQPPAPDVPSKPLPRTKRTLVLAGVREHFESARVGRGGFLKPSKRQLVDICVSKDLLDKAFAVAAKLFRTLEDRGHQVMLAPRGRPLHRPELDQSETGRGDTFSLDPWTPDRPTVVFVGTLAFGLTLYETSERVEVRHVNGEYVRVARPTKAQGKSRSPWRDWTYEKDLPSGRLCLRATSPYPVASWEKRWKEEKPGDLRKRLEEIVSDLEREAPKLAKLVETGEREAEEQRRRWEEEARERQRRWEEEERERRRVEAERRRAQALKESREHLLAIVDAWTLAHNVEAFFEDAERRAEQAGEDEREALRQRIELARELLGGLDALERFRSWKSPEER